MGRRVLKFDGLSGRGLWWRLAPQFIVSVTGLASRPTGHSERSEESWYAAYLRQSALNTGRREGCRLAARAALRIISTCHVVHPLPLRGIPLKGTQDVTGLASCPHSHSERSEESWYAAYLRQSALNTGRREGCRLAARAALRIISTCHVVHPLPLRGIPLKGTQDVTGLASCPHSHSERSEESWYAAYLRQSALNTGQREAAAFDGSPLSRFAGLLHGKASHVIFRSLSLPYKSRSLATPVRVAE